MSGNFKTSTYSAGGGNCLEVNGPWRTPSYSSNKPEPSCVETRVVSGTGAGTEGLTVRVRDTKDRDRGGVMAVGAVAWTAFLAGVVG